MDDKNPGQVPFVMKHSEPAKEQPWIKTYRGGLADAKDTIGCGQHFHGDSRNDAMNAWCAHVSKDHREDWDD